MSLAITTENSYLPRGELFRQTVSLLLSRASTLDCFAIQSKSLIYVSFVMMKSLIGRFAMARQTPLLWKRACDRTCVAKEGLQVVRGEFGMKINEWETEERCVAEYIIWKELIRISKILVYIVKVFWCKSRPLQMLIPCHSSLHVSSQSSRYLLATTPTSTTERSVYEEFLLLIFKSFVRL